MFSCCVIKRVYYLISHTAFLLFRYIQFIPSSLFDRELPIRPRNGKERREPFSFRSHANSSAANNSSSTEVIRRVNSTVTNSGIDSNRPLAGASMVVDAEDEDASAFFQRSRLRPGANTAISAATATGTDLTPVAVRGGVAMVGPPRRFGTDRELLLKPNEARAAEAGAKAAAAAVDNRGFASAAHHSNTRTLGNTGINTYNNNGSNSSADGAEAEIDLNALLVQAANSTKKTARASSTSAVAVAAEARATDLSRLDSSAPSRLRHPTLTATALRRVPASSVAAAAARGTPALLGTAARLSHWSRGGGSTGGTPNMFARFSRPLGMLMYTDAEYEALHDPEWTRLQTDVLMEMVERYDARFTVIHDRFAAAVTAAGGGGCAIALATPGSNNAAAAAAAVAALTGGGTGVVAGGAAATSLLTAHSQSLPATVSAADVRRAVKIEDADCAAAVAAAVAAAEAAVAAETGSAAAAVSVKVENDGSNSASAAGGNAMIDSDSAASASAVDSKAGVKSSSASAAGSAAARRAPLQGMALLSSLIATRPHPATTPAPAPAVTATTGSAAAAAAAAAREAAARAAAVPVRAPPRLVESAIIPHAVAPTALPSPGGVSGVGTGPTPFITLPATAPGELVYTRALAAATGSDGCNRLAIDLVSEARRAAVAAAAAAAAKGDAYVVTGTRINPDYNPEAAFTSSNTKNKASSDSKSGSAAATAAAGSSHANKGGNNSASASASASGSATTAAAGGDASAPSVKPATTDATANAILAAFNINPNAPAPVPSVPFPAAVADYGGNGTNAVTALTVTGPLPGSSAWTLSAAVMTDATIVPAGVKSVEQLRARYYHIQRHLHLARAWRDPDVHLNPVVMTIYALQYETERRRQLGLIFARSPDLVRNIAVAVMHVRKLAKVLRGVKRAVRMLYAQQQQQQQQAAAAAAAAAAHRIVGPGGPGGAGGYHQYGGYPPQHPGQHPNHPGQHGYGGNFYPPPQQQQHGDGSGVSDPRFGAGGAGGSGGAISIPLPSHVAASASASAAAAARASAAPAGQMAPPVLSASASSMRRPPSAAASAAGAGSVMSAAAAAVPYTLAADGVTHLAAIPPACLAGDVRNTEPGSGLRSTHLSAELTLMGRHAKRLETELFSLGFKTGKNQTSPFDIPTELTSTLYDSLRADIITMVNLQRHLASREQVRSELAAESGLAGVAAGQKKRREVPGTTVGIGAGGMVVEPPQMGVPKRSKH